MERFRWCFIGTGKLAHKVAKQILRSGKHTIVSCYTRSFEKAKEFADTFGCTAYKTAEEAMSVEIDGVYIVTTHNVHYHFAKLALMMGKPVLVEKAFTVTAEETKELIDLAREKDVYLAEGMWTWFSPCANQVLDWVKRGEIGKINHVRFTYHLNSINYAPRVSDAKRAGGALLDVTVYPITYAYRLFGYPDSIESKGTIRNGVDEGEEIVFTYSNGLKVEISASIVDMKGLEKMTITGERGKITSSFYHSTTKATLKKGLFQRTKYKGGSGISNSMVVEFDHVAEEIRQGLKESNFVPLGVTYDVMKLMDTIAGQIGLSYTDLEE